MIPVIDLFAGPGGLGEGFSSLADDCGNPVFQIIMSIEKDPTAHKTLRLRSFVRKLLRKNGTLPKEYIRFLEEPNPTNREQLISCNQDLWEASGQEAMCEELVEGDMTLVEEGRKRLAEFHLDSENDQWILIGGPPCQAYSLVGRSRRAHDETLEDDVKQTLYKCYLSFISELKPTVFVMENVKGLLSARRKGESVFARIQADMAEAGYTVRSLVTDHAKSPRDFVVKAEQYGVPQKRHRVILLGIRNRDEQLATGTLSPKTEITLREALKGIPRIQSGFSSRSKQFDSWVNYVINAAEKLLDTPEGQDLSTELAAVKQHIRQLNMSENTISSEIGPYQYWYRKQLLGQSVLPNHQSRTHMATDLDRYLFCATYASKHGESARLADFPSYLYPKHQNVLNRTDKKFKFNDRFRAQVWDQPATTVTSHISKDGHYYIHPDPLQCRSLTVREAARLQTFPDDYFFEGNRTSQYTQVGNAVPPFLAKQIAAIVADFLDALQ